MKRYGKKSQVSFGRYQYDAFHITNVSHIKNSLGSMHFEFQDSQRGMHFQPTSTTLPTQNYSNGLSRSTCFVAYSLALAGASRDDVCTCGSPHGQS